MARTIVTLAMSPGHPWDWVDSPLPWCLAKLPKVRMGYGCLDVGELDWGGLAPHHYDELFPSSHPGACLHGERAVVLVDHAVSATGEGRRGLRDGRI